MAIKLGNTGINKIYLGATEIKKAYLGSVLVYDNTSIYNSVSVIYTLREVFKWDNAVLTLRRSSDNAETSVFFDTNGKISLTSTVSAGGTLGTWIGANNAFVKEWFGLTPNNIIDTNKIASQTTASDQPQFISSGVILTKNGEPAIDFLSDTRYLVAQANTDLDSGNDYSLFVVNNVLTNFGCLVSTTDTFYDDRYTLFTDRTINKLGGQLKASGVVTRANLLNQVDSADSRLITAIVTASSHNLHYNATIQESISWVGSYGNDSLKIGAQLNDSAPLNGTIQEITIFPSDKTSDLTELNADINNYYSIY